MPTTLPPPSLPPKDEPVQPTKPKHVVTDGL